VNRLGIKPREFVFMPMITAKNNGTQIVVNKRQLIPHYIQQTFLHKIKCFSYHLNLLLVYRRS